MQTATYRTEHMTNTGVNAVRRYARQYAKRRTGAVAMDTLIAVSYTHLYKNKDYIP